MRKKVCIAAAAMAVALLPCARAALAADNFECGSTVTRETLVRCALDASLEARSEGLAVEAIRGRKITASTWLPSNPVLSFTAADRRTASGDARAFNWHAALSQEVEIAGQRGARLAAVEASVVAEEKRFTVVRREVVARAWRTFFDVAAAQEEQKLAETLTGIGRGIAFVARAKAEQGLTSRVDADVAEATAVQFVQAQLAAERRRAASHAAMAVILGLDPQVPLAVPSNLDPIVGIEDAARRASQRASTDRPEVQAAEASRRAFQNSAVALRRSRVPSPALSVFMQTDGFNERVWGAGIAVPVPLPSPVGRTYAGEIAEDEALARRAETEAERLRRGARLELVTALREVQSRRKEVEAFDPARIERAEGALRSLGEEVQAGRLNLRDALITQQALVEFLRAHLAARWALSVASVELARVAGLFEQQGDRP